MVKFCPNADKYAPIANPPCLKDLMSAAPMPQKYDWTHPPPTTRMSVLWGRSLLTGWSYCGSFQGVAPTSNSCVVAVKSFIWPSGVRRNLNTPWHLAAGLLVEKGTTIRSREPPMGISTTPDSLTGSTELMPARARRAGTRSRIVLTYRNGSQAHTSGRLNLRIYATYSLD